MLPCRYLGVVVVVVVLLPFYSIHSFTHFYFVIFKLLSTTKTITIKQ